MILALLLPYLLGSVNFSIIISRIIANEDVRTRGSENAGFTNVLRTYGKLAGAVVLVCDILKAVLAFVTVIYLLPSNNANLYLASVGVILGHNFPIFHRFKGGKGVVVSLVSVLFVSSFLGCIADCVGILTLIFSGTASLAFIVGSTLFVVITLIFRFGDWFAIFFALFVWILGLIMHRKNIERLLRGAESKIGSKK